MADKSEIHRLISSPAARPVSRSVSQSEMNKLIYFPSGISRLGISSNGGLVYLLSELVAEIFLRLTD